MMINDDLLTHYSKSSLHSISPYVGKLRPELASQLVLEYSAKGGAVFDPFCGSGTVALEAWRHGRKSYAVDLNYYAYLLTKAKLFPYHSLEECLNHFDEMAFECLSFSENFREVPEWVSVFFHPETLSEILAWVKCAKSRNEWFILACLMGILHHQRPGFLSYPSSHGAPYLRYKKYPKEEYPEMYEYRNVKDRLCDKIKRTYSKFPTLDFSVERNVYNADTLDCCIESDTNMTIITSPPYMRSLTYARDNRLRLWFLGKEDWQTLDKETTYTKREFADFMEKCFSKWSLLQRAEDICVLVMGDIIFNKQTKESLPEMIHTIADKLGYDLINVYQDPVSYDRKMQKKESSISREIVSVYKRRH